MRKLLVVFNLAISERPQLHSQDWDLTILNGHPERDIFIFCLKGWIFSGVDRGILEGKVKPYQMARSSPLKDFFFPISTSIVYNTSDSRSLIETSMKNEGLILRTHSRKRQVASNVRHEHCNASQTNSELDTRPKARETRRWFPLGAKGTQGILDDRADGKGAAVAVDRFQLAQRRRDRRCIALVSKLPVLLLDAVEADEKELPGIPVQPGNGARHVAEAVARENLEGNVTNRLHTFRPDLQQLGLGVGEEMVDDGPGYFVVPLEESTRSPLVLHYDDNRTALHGKL